ncbi:nicotinate-nucleotide pyrophosphorylase [Streptomyces lydicamycinicus]|uniref:Nicotinate-nucleotide pyrophosphorylase n=1 Tax=Streptomyces lydicamycinicus TaxID=1546107 RepID=A0A0P4R297_9ACTN|nr:nicotinate-nucleotide pyrophosphorylase [Streptomyces lydicamycinicus]
MRTSRYAPAAARRARWGCVGGAAEKEELTWIAGPEEVLVVVHGWCEGVPPDGLRRSAARRAAGLGDGPAAWCAAGPSS